MDNIIEKLRGKLIVSCQALEYEPLYGDGVMAKMAKAALIGGASGIRANSVRDIVQIKEVIDLPLIGIIKKVYEESDVYITPTMVEVDAVVEAGAEIVALDCTLRKRPDVKSLDELIPEIKNKYPNILVMADISTLEEAINAERLGVDIVSTTLSGYTSYSPTLEGPDFELIRSMKKSVNCAIIAEGRITEPAQVKKCLELGATAVVVGGAITRPVQITERFVKAIN